LAREHSGDVPSRKGEDGRGRGATTPSDIPLRGWKDILWRVYHNIPEHRVISIAAGVTFFVLLAIFPGIAALVAIYGLFADPSSIGQHLNDLSGVLPGGATEVIGLLKSVTGRMWCCVSTTAPATRHLRGRQSVDEISIPISVQKLK
jgi:hypothetical protein